MTAFIIIIGSIVVGWAWFEYFHPEGSVQKLKDMGEWDD